jgi:hypothetical protein
MTDPFVASYLEDVIHRFQRIKALAGRALAQVADDELFTVLDAEGNSIALLMKHLAGNMRARWRDPFASDGETAGRDRDREFEREAGDTRASLNERWEAGWGCLFDALASFRPADLGATVRVRGRPYSLLQAINRQLSHYAYHVGQIVFLAKHLRAGDWRSLSVPRGQSRAFDRAMRAGGDHAGSAG